MRKVIMLNRISIDGFFAGPNGDFDWFIHEPEVDRAAHEMMGPETLLLGRVTYQMFAGYWPDVGRDADAPQAARAQAEELNQMRKVVFSNTLREVTWVNAELVRGDVPQEVRRIKQGDGADITIFGSGTIVQQLASQGLIDEYLVIMTPVILGKGKSLFHDIGKVDLKLIEARNFPSGNILLHYKNLSLPA